MALQVYGTLLAKVNGELLREEYSITVIDHVGKPTTIRIDSRIPGNGPEFEPRARLGQRIKVDVFLRGAFRELDPHQEPILTVEGPVVASAYEHQVNDAASLSFTVEQQTDK